MACYCIRLSIFGLCHRMLICWMGLHQSIQAWLETEVSPWLGAFSITLIALVLFCAIAVAIDSYISKRKRDKETDEQLKAGLKKLVELGYVIERENGYLPTMKGLRELERRQ